MSVYKFSIKRSQHSPAANPVWIVFLLSAQSLQSRCPYKTASETIWQLPHGDVIVRACNKCSHTLTLCFLGLLSRFPPLLWEQGSLSARKSYKTISHARGKPGTHSAYNAVFIRESKRECLFCIVGKVEKRIEIVLRDFFLSNCSH